MKALVVYESMFGNTQTIARAVGRGLRQAGIDVEVWEVGEVQGRDFAVDLLVVGGPTHSWGMSRKLTRRNARDQAQKMGRNVVSTQRGVREWLKDLPDNRSMAVAAAFDTALRQTSWIPTGSAAKKEAARLRKKHYPMIQPPVQFYVRDTAGPLEDDEEDRAVIWGEQLGRTVVTLRQGGTAGREAQPGV